MSRAARTALLASVLALVLATPTPAGAAEPTGNTTLVVSSSKAALLAKRGIAFGGVGGAQTAGRETRLQISAGEIGETAASFSHRGGLRLSTGEGKRRRARVLRGLRVELGGESVLSARLNGKRQHDLRPRGPSRPTQLQPHRRHGAVARRPSGLATKRDQAAEPQAACANPARSAGQAAHESGGDARRGRKAVSLPPNRPCWPSRPAPSTSPARSLTWHVRDSWIRYVSSSSAPQTQDGASAEPADPEQRAIPAPTTRWRPTRR